MNIPISVDKKPNGSIVRRKSIGEDGYAENIEYQLSITPTSGYLVVEYFGEDGTKLSDTEVEFVILNSSAF